MKSAKINIAPRLSFSGMLRMAYWEITLFVLLFLGSIFGGSLQSVYANSNGFPPLYNISIGLSGNQNTLTVSVSSGSAAHTRNDCSDCIHTQDEPCKVFFIEDAYAMPTSAGITIVGQSLTGTLNISALDPGMDGTGCSSDGDTQGSNGTFTASGTVNVSSLGNGTYTASVMVCHSVFGTDCRTSTSDFTITNRAAPVCNYTATASATPTGTVCLGTPVDFTGGTTNASNCSAQSNRTWLWTDTLTGAQAPVQSPQDVVFGGVGSRTGRLDVTWDGIQKTASTGTINIVDCAPPPSAPTCSLSLSPNTIQAGQSSTLSWTTQNAVSASLNQGIGNVSVPNGLRTVSPLSTKTYTMTVTGQNGQTATCSRSLEVTAAPPPPPPTCVPNAREDLVRADGQHFDPDFLSIPTAIVDTGSGTASVTVVNTSNTCSYNLGLVSYKIFYPPPPATDGTTYLTTQRRHADNYPVVIGPGQTKTFSVQTPTNCNYQLDLYEGSHGAPDPLDETFLDLLRLDARTNGTLGLCGTTNVSITKTVNKTTVQPGQTATYTLTASNASTATSPALNVTVEDVYDKSRFFAGSLPSGCSNNAVQGKITCTVGTLNPGQTWQRSYSMTAKNNPGQANNTASVFEGGVFRDMDTASVTIVVPSAPTCTLTANPDTIQEGQSSTLSWTTQNSTSASINHGIGNVSVPTGTKVVTPPDTRLYTMTVTGPGGTSVCTALVEVAAPQAMCNDANGDGFADSCMAGGNMGLSCSTIAECPTEPIEPVFNVHKAVDKPASGGFVLHEGDEVMYTVTVSNTGNGSGSVLLVDDITNITNGGSTGNIFDEVIICSSGSIGFSGSLSGDGVVFENFTGGNTCTVTYKKTVSSQGIASGTSDITNTARIFSCPDQ